MSGPKGGWIIIAGGSAIIGLVAAWRQREEQSRRVSSAQRRDTQRARDLQRSAGQIESTLQNLEAQLQRIAGDSASTFIAAELHAWEQEVRTIRSDQRRLAAELSGAQARQSAAVGTSEGQGTYEGGYFDKFDFAPLQRRIEIGIQEGTRILAVASLRQEMEQTRVGIEEQREQASSAQRDLLQLQESLQTVAALPHQELTPGAYANLERSVGQVIEAIERGSFAEASTVARSGIEAAARQATAINTARTDWERRREQATAAITGARQAIASIDEDLVERYAPGQLAAARARLVELERMLANAQQPTRQPGTYDNLEKRANVLQQEAVKLQASAFDNATNARQRREVVRHVVGALEEMGFNVGAHLADKSNQLSDFIISAGRPSGQEWGIRIDSRQQVHMDTEDGVNGADCVTDVRNLQQRLRPAGINLYIREVDGLDAPPPPPSPDPHDEIQLPEQRQMGEG